MGLLKIESIKDFIEYSKELPFRFPKNYTGAQVNVDDTETPIQIAMLK